MNKTWYTVEETAEVLGISQYTVRQKLLTKQMNGTKAGREWRILKSEVDSILGIKPVNDKKDIYIKELEEKIKYLNLQVETFKSVASSLIKVIE